MSLLPFDALPPWAMLLSLPVYLVVGIVLGVLYFGSLWRSVRRFARGGRMTTVIALMCGRFVLLAAVLTLASRVGALALLLMALGVLIARFAVARRVREVAP